MEKRLEYFGKVIKVVTELMEVTDQEILGKSRRMDVVDARWMVIYLMKEAGYTTRQIVPLICHKRRTIDNAISLFEDRVKYSFNGLGNTLAIARQLLQE